MALFDFLIHKYKMRNLFNLLIFYSTVTFSQTAKEFLINDNDKVFRTLITDIIAESKNYGYNLNRNNQGDYIFEERMSKCILLTKKIGNSYEEGFPNYSVGYINKKYSFTQSNIIEAYPWEIETEIVLLQYENVGITQIKNYYNKTVDDIVKNNIKNNYITSKTSNKLNFKSSISGQYYDLCNESIIQKPCPDSEKDENEDCISGCNVFLRGESFESERGIDNAIQNSYYLTFSFKDKGISKLLEKANTIVSNLNSSFDNIRFTVGGQDMRKINQYDLEAMVKFFLEDCKKSNNNVPEINTLKATFEPLEGSVIALSYGFGDDTTIVIKVDPEKWAKSSIEKKWYVLYHELGHDVLNLEHGQGGKMMFNFADKEYTWDDFFKDKDYMINFIKTPDNIKINFGEIKKTIATVNIGTQEWTTINLNVSKYRNGDIIPEVKDQKKWSTLTTGAWCYYNNDPINGNIYGKLYNWYAVNDTRGLAPEGFHIPSEVELRKITDLTEEAKFKDSTGFNGLPGGARKDDSIFKGIGFECTWWSSTKKDEVTKMAWNIWLYYNDEISGWTIDNKTNGYSVRCVKD